MFVEIALIKKEKEDGITASKIDGKGKPSQAKPRHNHKEIL